MVPIGINFFFFSLLKNGFFLSVYCFEGCWAKFLVWDPIDEDKSYLYMGFFVLVSVYFDYSIYCVYICMYVKVCILVFFFFLINIFLFVGDHGVWLLFCGMSGFVL